MNQKRLALLIVTLLVAGCGKATDAPAPAAGLAKAAGKRTLESNGGAYTVTYETAPDPISTNDPFDLKFSVMPKQSPAAGAPVTVDVDARMPAHFHGMNRTPKLSRQPDGSYKAEGMLFHMAGHWELYFDIAQGGRTERAQVDVNLK